MSEASERTPLTGQEYYAIRALFGLISGYETSLSRLEARAKRSDRGTWRDMNMITKVADKTVISLLKTVPDEKLLQIRRELDNTIVKVEVKRSVVPQPAQDEFAYVPIKPLDALLNRILTWECAFCEKQGKEIKHCECRKELKAIFPYEIDEQSGDGCGYKGYSIEEHAS